MLASCHESLLQRVVNRCDASDLFLLRLVCKRFRDAVAQRVRRVLLPDTHAPSDLLRAFPRVTSLDVRCLQRPQSAWLLSALAQLPDLRELLWIDMYEHADAWEALRGLSSLTRVVLVRIRAGQGQLGSLAANCTALRWLECYGGQLDFADLLSAVTQLADTLTHLELNGSRVEVPQQGLQALNTGRLQRLQLSNRLPAGTCQQLAAFTSLSSLELRYIHFSGVPLQDLEHLNALTRLTSLSFHASDVTAASVAHLTALTNLLVLDLASIGCRYPLRMAETHRDLPAAIACFPSLTDLNITCCRLVDVSSELMRLTRLTRLEAQLTKLLQQPLLPLPSLRVLELQGSVGAEARLRHLSGLCSLTRLSLAGTTAHGGVQLSEEGMRWLAGLTALQHLCLANNNVTGGGLEQLAQLPALRALDLDQAELPLECDLSPLERLRLERLRLPEALEAADQLPPALQVPIMRGRRWDSMRWGAVQW